MSGGVDSSVSAALLQREGYEVIGVFMKVWQPDFLPCTWREERLDAMRVAAHLGIPLLTWDFEKEYKEGVVDYMIHEYRRGRTPNPDVMCNREVKFGAFSRRAIQEGADFVATGHYARVVKSQQSIVNSKYKLLKGVDSTKDQAYFLWTLKQEQLSKTLFPIGKYKKTEVRVLAKKFNLPVAEKKDSQGLCFMGKLDMKDFLAHYIKEKEGSVLNEAGEIIGTHRGVFFYTLGERHGFSVLQKKAEDMPYYVVAKDFKNNTLTVTHQEKRVSVSAMQEAQVSEISFCKGIVPDASHFYTAQVRYHGAFYQCKIVLVSEGCSSVHFEKPVTVDAGQSVVFYHEDECLGGGIVA